MAPAARPYMIAIMSDPAIDDIFHTHGRKVEIAAGNVLFRTDDVVAGMYLLVSGNIALARVLENGTEFILHRAGAMELLAEASYFADRYRCDAIAMTDVDLLYVDRRMLREMDSRDCHFINALARLLARRVHDARARSEIMSLRGVANRLDAWLALNDGGLPEKGQWRDLALELAVSPEALYRELARRRTRR